MAFRCATCATDGHTTIYTCQRCDIDVCEACAVLGPLVQEHSDDDRGVPSSAHCFSCATPIGHNRCTACKRLSPLYENWATCRSCMAEICPDCAAAGSLREGDGSEDEDHAPVGDTVLCQRCDSDA